MLELSFAVLLDLAEVGILGKAERIEVADGRQSTRKSVAELGLFVVTSKTYCRAQA